MKLSLPACLTTIVLALATPAFAESTGQMTTITGKVLDLATYMTHDHNMDSMKGDAMKGGKACPSLLGVVSRGKAYPLTFPMGSSMAATACAHLGKTATMTGPLYQSNGLTILLVESMH